MNQCNDGAVIQPPFWLSKFPTQKALKRCFPRQIHAAQGTGTAESVASTRKDDNCKMWLGDSFQLLVPWSADSASQRRHWWSEMVGPTLRFLSGCLPTLSDEPEVVCGLSHFSSIWNCSTWQKNLLRYSWHSVGVRCTTWWFGICNTRQSSFWNALWGREALPGLNHGLTAPLSSPPSSPFLTWC